MSAQATWLKQLTCGCGCGLQKAQISGHMVLLDRALALVPFDGAAAEPKYLRKFDWTWPPLNAAATWQTKWQCMPDINDLHSAGPMPDLEDAASETHARFLLNRWC